MLSMINIFFLNIMWWLTKRQKVQYESFVQKIIFTSIVFKRCLYQVRNIAILFYYFRWLTEFDFVSNWVDLSHWSEVRCFFLLLVKNDKLMLQVYALQYNWLSSKRIYDWLLIGEAICENVFNSYFYIDNECHLIERKKRYLNVPSNKIKLLQHLF